MNYVEDKKSHELMRWDVKPKRGDKVSFNIIKNYPEGYNGRFSPGRNYNASGSGSERQPSPPNVLLATNISVIEFGSDRILELCSDFEANYEDGENNNNNNSNLAVKPISLLEEQKKYMGIIYSVKEVEGEFGFIKCICKLDGKNCLDKLKDTEMYDGIANGLEVFFRREHFMAPLSTEMKSSTPKSGSGMGQGFGTKVKIGSIVVFRGAWVKERPQAHNIQLLMVENKPLMISDFLMSGEICLMYESMVIAAPKELKVSKHISEHISQSIDYQVKILMNQLMKELYYIVGSTSELKVGDRVVFTPKVDVSTHVQGILRSPKEEKDEMVLLCSKVSSL